MDREHAMPNTKRAVAYINLNVLEENYYKIRQKLSPHVKLLCVVKADAYGHGAVDVSRRLESLGVTFLGVATIDEGIELRENKIKCPVLIMSGVMPWDDIETIVQFSLTPVVYNTDMLDMVCGAAKRFQRPVKMHLKIDTGMGRLGFLRNEIPEVIGKIKATSNVCIDGLMSHFSSSETRDDYGCTQIDTFNVAIDQFRREGFFLKDIHMANSGAIVNYPEAHFTMVRAGISLYGSHASRELKEKLPTRQVMKFVSKVAHIREFPKGYALSYGRTYITRRKTRVAYIPVGYADGYPRSLSNKGFVLINNNRSHVIGRICMDWFLVDITDCGEVNAQDEVILLGDSATDTINADEIGEIAGTIPYEILCKISKRVTRVYL